MVITGKPPVAPFTYSIKRPSQPRMSKVLFSDVDFVVENPVAINVTNGTPVRMGTFQIDGCFNLV